MKRFFLVLAAVALVGLAACEKQNPTPDPDPSGGVTPTPEPQPEPEPEPQPEPETPLSPREQQAKLNATAEALMNALDLDNWKADVDWAYQAFKELEGINGSADADLEQWAEELEESILEYSEGDHWELFKMTIDLSQITGHFTETNGVFHREDADDLSLDIQLNGEPVRVQFTCTRGTEPMLVYLTEKVYEYYDYEQQTYVTENVASREYWVAIPKTAQLKITRSGKDFVVFNAEFDVTDVDADTILNPANDKLSVKASITAAGYELNAGKVEYSPTNAAVDVTLKQGSQLLISANAKGAYTIEDENFLPKSAEVAIDLMGMTQVKGTLASYDKLMEAAEAVDEALKSENEALVDLAFENLEKCYDLGVYYDGGSLKQATLGFDYVVWEEGTGSVVVVIRFADGTAIAADEYFSEQYFAGLMGKASIWLQKISDYFSNLK